MFQIEESYMDEAKALTRRYELERQEIEKVRDAKYALAYLMHQQERKIMSMKTVEEMHM